jgi:hypothetical protein
VIRSFFFFDSFKSLGDGFLDEIFVVQSLWQACERGNERGDRETFTTLLHKTVWISLFFEVGSLDEHHIRDYEVEK